MLIFKRARGKDEIKDGAPPSSGNGTWTRSYTSVSSWTNNTQTPAIGCIVFKPLTSYYIDEMEKWLRANPGHCVTQFQVAAIFGRACCRAAGIGNAANGFARTGVWPVDRTVFQDHDFSASTAFQDDSGTSPVETTSSNPGIQVQGQAAVLLSLWTLSLLYRRLF
jgi:hypothetical protein